MRIRGRFQTQIPISPPDLPILSHAHLGASSSAVSAGGAVVVDVLLHQDGDLPIQRSGCNAHGPPTLSGAVGGGDLQERPNLHRPMPSRMENNGDDVRKTTAAQVKGNSWVMLLQGEQDQEVVDAHRRTWSLGGLHSVHRSGADASQSMLVPTEAFPVKKRRGTGGGRAVEVEGSNEKKAMTTNNKPMRTSTTVTTTSAAAGTTTCVGDNDNGIKDNSDDHVVEGNGKNSKRKSPAVLMEGSRCSRVNGRGWRCCQQTLVGYSLCEHHLGKGRLRSVSSVKCNGNNNGSSSNRPKRRKKKKQQQQQEPPKVENGDMEEEELKVINANRKRKIGIVKARSISSLLDQTNHAAATMTMPIPLPAKEEEETPPTLHVPPLNDSATV